MKEKVSNKGITLIALIITIIVLLILAGVSIATLTGENGILAKAERTTKETEIAEAKEQAKLDILAWLSNQIEKGENTNLTKDEIKAILVGKEYVKELGEQSFTTVKNGYEIPYSEIYNKIIPIPTITHGITPDEGTMAPSVEIQITVQDNGLGIQGIQKPDGKIENSNTVTYTATKNGEYTFIIIDKEGKEIKHTVTITNIIEKMYVYQNGVSSCGSFIGSRNGLATSSFLDGGTYLQLSAVSSGNGNENVVTWTSNEPVDMIGYSKMFVTYNVISFKEDGANHTWLYVGNRKRYDVNNIPKSYRYKNSIYWFAI